MCDCHIVTSNNLIEPISMVSKKMSWTYTDGLGISHVLVDEFDMNFVAGGVSIEKELDELGNTTAYVFKVKKVG